ncbi:hypothetical protein [Nitrosopumilus sp.]|uniref:hypothetical protein n=1 Tax=Nitrosopumilus sp. TaxID=2024843 RepID=UPI00292CC619|nr:hypothetical protein [Nitrosopumilus sp.]
MSVPIKCPICNIGKMIKSDKPELLVEYDTQENKSSSHGVRIRSFFCEKCNYVMLYRE